MKKLLAFTLLLIVSACQKQTQPAEKTITAFAAASTTDVMKELAVEFKKEGGTDVQFNFASSGALARQIDAGAPADLFISANKKWMTFLEEKELLMPGTRADVAMNKLVLIAPKESGLTYAAFPGNLTGKLAVGDFKSVPAGNYAEKALNALGWFAPLKDRFVKGDSVRKVLIYVEQGEVDAGIVYQTDALRSAKVKILGTFPADSHPPIVYPAACLKDGENAKAFLDFIQSEKAQAIWIKHGFAPPTK